MILSSGQFLKSTRINAIVRDQAENYQRQLPLRFLDRTASVNADDEEIIGTYTGKVYAADIIADDQAAAVYDAGQFEFTTNVIPNIKVGRRLSQSLLNRLNRMERGNITRDEVGVFEGWEVSTARALVQGVDDRRNMLIAAMQMDSAVYNRLGIQMSVTWGMPSAYKVTPSTPWTTAATAQPITDILTLKEYAQTTDGETFDRVTMPRADFRLMVATTEFKNLIQGLVNQPLGATTGAFTPYDRRMEGFASQLLGMDLEFEDKTYTEQAPAGTIAATRVQPLGKVILSSKADDRNPGSMDWANAIVTESTVAGVVGNYDALGGPQFGPVSYYTGPADLNPPNLLAWAVCRGFPRKHRKTATAVLTVR